jgi:NAD(P)-dependent dehydrogenase (short-subunit alcohol dehydrogenase family)
MELKGKVVVITGALGTLGKAVAQAAADMGATVIGVDRVDGAKLAGVEIALHLILVIRRRRVIHSRAWPASMAASTRW